MWRGFELWLRKWFGTASGISKGTADMWAFVNHVMQLTGEGKQQLAALVNRTYVGLQGVSE